MAASQPPPLPTPAGLAPPAPPNLTKDSATDKVSSSHTESIFNVADRENPGTIEDLHKRCKDVMPTNFEGAKLMIQKGLSSHFQVSHTINLSSSTPSGYKFGATYVGTKQLSPSEAFPVVLGDIDPSGNMNATIIHQFTPKIRCKFGSQIQDNKMSAAQLTTDYKGDDYTASLTLVNTDLINESGVAVVHYLQSVSNSCEILFVCFMWYEMEISPVLSNSIIFFVPFFFLRAGNEKLGIRR